MFCRRCLANRCGQVELGELLARVRVRHEGFTVGTIEKKVVDRRSFALLQGFFLVSLAALFALCLLHKFCNIPSEETMEKANLFQQNSRFLAKKA